MVERLLALGASPADIGQGQVPWVVLADPEGNPFCVMERRTSTPVGSSRCLSTWPIPIETDSSGRG